MNTNGNTILKKEVVAFSQPPIPPFYPARILVVDGDPHARAMNAVVLMKSGYKVQTTINGADAWKALNGRAYDLLITENEMPELTGMQLVKNLRSNGGAMPVIMTSAKLPAAELKPDPMLRLEAALLKPVPGGDLLETVKNVLHAAERSAYGLPSGKTREETMRRTDAANDPLRPAPAKHTKRILMVDDEPMICRLCVELLNDSGYEVDTAENGAVAWDALQRNRYDLLITDQEMPELSGLELIRKIQSARMTLPVIMVSGAMPVEELERHPELRINAALPKPFNIMEFINVVEKILQATGGVINQSKLFRDCALLDTDIIPAERPDHAPRRGQPNPSHRILVVDDDQDTRQFSVDLLACAGYEADGAQDGAAGWDALQSFDYDLVVTDNKMPRMTGVEMIAKLRSARIQIPVIMATGNPPTLEFERRPWLKPDCTLQRPFSDDDLLVAVKKILRPDDGSSPGQGKPLPNSLPP